MEVFDAILKQIDDVVWGPVLIIAILATGIYLTVRLGFVQIRHLGTALKFMVKNEEDGKGEVTSFGALCTALSATIGTGNIVGVATAIVADREHCSGWKWLPSLEWQPNMQRDFWRSNTAPWTRMAGCLADHSIISRMEWAKNGNGSARYSHFSESVLV